MRQHHLLAGLISAAILCSACAFDAIPLAPTLPAASPRATSVVELGAPQPATPGASAVNLTGTGVAARVTITFAVREDERPLYEPLIERFEQDNPEIHVQLVNVETVVKEIVTPEGTFSHDEESIRETLSTADTAALGLTPEAIAKGWVRDLTPLMDADPTFDRSDFYPGALAMAGQEGRTYTLPHTLWVELLAYNKALWARHALPAPTHDWSWSDLLAAAEQLAEKRGTSIEVYGMLDWDTWATVLRHELAGGGVDPADILRLDQPEIVAALERVAALARSGAIYVAPGGRASPDVFQQLIRNQQVGIWPADMLDRTPSAFEVGTVPAPSAQVGVDGYIMSGGTQHPLEAWRWLAFLSRQGIRRPSRSASTIGQLPARRSVAEKIGYWQHLDAETTAAINTVLNRGAAPRLPDFDLRTFLLLRQAVAAVMGGGQTAREALRDAQAQLEQQLAQAPMQPTAASDRIVVATPAPAAPPDATKIIFGAPRSVVVQARQIADVFNGQNHGIFVEVKNIDTPNGPPRLADLATQMDCFAAAGPPSHADIPSLLDLQPLIDADATFTLDDYPSPLVTPFRQGSGLYGLPDAVDFRVLNYNPAAFDAAHLAYPTAAWTLDDFLSAAQQLTRGAGKNKHYGFASTVLPARDVFFFLASFGASATRGSRDTLAPNFTDPKVQQAIRAELDLLRNASPHARLQGYARGEAPNDAFALVAQGKVGMWFDFGANIFGLNQGGYAGIRPAIAPPPLGARSVTADDFYARGVYISARTAQPEACWSWLKQLTLDLAHLGGAFPARRSLALSQAFTSQAPPGAADVYHAYQAAFERTPAAGSGTDEREAGAIDYYWFLRAVDRVLQGQDLERELEEAQRLTEQYLACVRAGAKASTCATQVDPDSGLPGAAKHRAGVPMRAADH